MAGQMLNKQNFTPKAQTECAWALKTPDALQTRLRVKSLSPAQEEKIKNKPIKNGILQPLMPANSLAGFFISLFFMIEIQRLSTHFALTSFISEGFKQNKSYITVA